MVQQSLHSHFADKLNAKSVMALTPDQESCLLQLQQLAVADPSKSLRQQTVYRKTGNSSSAMCFMLFKLRTLDGRPLESDRFRAQEFTLEGNIKA